MKKQLILTIDEELIKIAKKQIPNISRFLEYCLKNYLGIGNGLIPTNKQQDLIHTISKCQLDLYLMNERDNIEEVRKKAELEEIHLAWRKLYAYYRDTRKIHPERMEHAVEKLGVSSEELYEIVMMAYAMCDKCDIDITDWYEVYEEYGWEGGDED